LPYGDKSENTLKEYVSSIISFLNHQNCKLIVVACNSAATVIHKLENLPFNDDRIVEVISPIVELVSKQKKFQKIGVIGTRKTIGSGMFDQKLSQLNSSLKIIARATPLLAPMIEDGFVEEDVLLPIFQRYFKGFGDCELIIPACTHYPIIYNQIEKYFDNGLKVLHTPKIIAEKVDEVLMTQQLFNSEKKFKEDSFYLSDITDDFLREAKLFLGSDVDFNLVSL
jgi:glutamate racemase